MIQDAKTPRTNKMTRQISFLLLTVFIMAGCASVDINDYAGTKPKLILEDYFTGQSKAWGIFQDRFGKVRRTFIVEINGTWDEKNRTLELVEDFTYNDGETEQRVWTITKTGDNTYEGTAGGVVGKAKGQTAGNAFNFKYSFDLPYKGNKLRVTFDDWMYLQDEHILFNKATIRKFGVTLGDVYIFFDKRGSGAFDT